MWKASSASRPALIGSSLQLVQREEQRNHVGARRPEARAGRNVRHRRDLDIRVDPENLESGPHQIVADLFDTIHPLRDGVLEMDLVVGRRAVDRQIDVLVDRRTQHESAVLAVVRREDRCRLRRGRCEVGRARESRRHLRRSSTCVRDLSACRSRTRARELRAGIRLRAPSLESRGKTSVERSPRSGISGSTAGSNARSPAFTSGLASRRATASR